MPNWPANNLPASPLPAIEVASGSELFLELDRDNLQRWLSDGEIARYRSISASNRKRQFLAGHFLVRKLAARLFGNLPGDWTYFQDSDDLRRLKCERIELVPYVSISHAGDWIAAAVSATPVGIDIETFSKEREFLAIAKHVFSDREAATLEACEPAYLKRDFYLYWTLKESVAKQFGSGLKFEVSRRQTAVPVSGSEAPDMQSWLCPEYVVALACGSRHPAETLGVRNAIHQSWRNIPVS